MAGLAFKGDATERCTSTRFRVCPVLAGSFSGRVENTRVGLCCSESPPYNEHHSFSASAVYRKGCADTMNVNSCTNLQPHLDSKTLQKVMPVGTHFSLNTYRRVLSRGAVFLCHHLCLSSLQYTSLAQFFSSQGTAGYDGRFLSTVFWGCLVSRACLTFLSLACRARPSSSGVYGSAGTAI